jgi:hypothetical protein
MGRQRRRQAVQVQHEHGSWCVADEFWCTFQGTLLFFLLLLLLWVPLLVFSSGNPTYQVTS